MNIDLGNNTALITASTDGIGFAVAAALAQSGAKVVVNGRTQPKLDAAIEKLRHLVPNGEFFGIAADAGTKAGCDSLVTQLPECDFLINNLGVAFFTPTLETSDEDYFRAFEINFLSSLRLSRAYVPGMIKRNHGRVVFSGTLTSVVSFAHTAYAATKAAQLHQARGIAQYTRDTNVTVNTVLIGMTHAVSLDNFIAESAKGEGVSIAEMEAKLIKTMHPASLRLRPANAEDVAAMFVYLCSPQSRATNGAVLSVEGGGREALL